MADAPDLKMYSDFKSPFAYLAFEPTLDLESRYHVRVRWIPFRLRIKGRGERSRYSEWKARYSYLDARRAAAPRGLTIRGPLAVYDSTPALVGGLWAESRGRLREYGRLVYERFFRRELAIDSPDAVAALVAELDLAPAEYPAWLGGPGREAWERAEAEAEEDHVFGVPLFFLAGEPFWGHDRLPLVEERLRAAGLER